MTASLCPRCGSAPQSTTTRYGIRYSCCGLWAWGNFPLVDRATHDARQAAHEAFDPLWKCGRLGRSEAYRLLADELGISLNHCHMKLMDASTAQQVPAAVDRIRLGL